MPANTRDIQRRIKSISNTKKVTRAMEMVAAAKMRRAVEGVLRTRTYANLSWATVLNLSKEKAHGKLHPLLTKKKEIKNVAIVLITSNRGLCGGYNANIINKVQQSILKYHNINDKGKVGVDFILLGKKGATVRKYYGYNIEADFQKNDLVSEIKEVVPITKIIVDGFLRGKYDKVMVAYTDFINPVNQKPRVKQLLPVDIESEDEELGILAGDSRVGTSKEFIHEKQVKHLKKSGYEHAYIFEPSPFEVLDAMIPRLVEVQIFQALLESNASEHSARMSAMRKATDAAGDLVQELTLYYNKTRQAAITNEISEISAGANALSQK